MMNHVKYPANTPQAQPLSACCLRSYMFSDGMHWYVFCSICVLLMLLCYPISIKMEGTEGQTYG